jgi:hypothetical protein
VPEQQNKPPPKQNETPFERFERLAKRVVRVPKESKKENKGDSKACNC